MSLTQGQIEFAGHMTERQAELLRALAYAAPVLLVGRRRASADMRTLERLGLARCGCANGGWLDLFPCVATPSGRALADQFLERGVKPAPGPSRTPAACGA